MIVKEVSPKQYEIPQTVNKLENVREFVYSLFTFTRNMDEYDLLIFTR